VMVRSIFLRGFDQQIANFIGQQMEDHGVKFVRGAVPVSIEKIQDGTPGLYKVKDRNIELF
jgi:thioredoxin reductase (NADPH)